MNGWRMDRLIVGWMNGRMMDGYMVEWMKGLTGGWADG